MPYPKAKIYKQGGHFIAIPHTEQPHKERRKAVETEIFVEDPPDEMSATTVELAPLPVEESQASEAETNSQVWLILRCIFDIVAEDSGKPSPMEKVVVPNYETKKGSALTYDEEKTLVKYCVKNTGKDTSSALLVLLYTGLRRSELKTLEVIDGAWLECETSKERMGKNAVKRRIPFTPMLKRVLPYIDFEKAKNANLNSLSNAMKRVLPNHHLHELRYSFITRCKEAGVHGEVVLLWDGHEEDRTLHSSKVDRGYTDFSKEFQLKEALKVDYLKWNS